MVKQFIEDNFSGNEIKKCFRYGNCYWFAKILKDRFNGEIMYLPIDNHFVCKIKGKLYDITGEVKADEKVYRWRDYQRIEPIESKRIIKQCILKE